MPAATRREMMGGAMMLAMLAWGGRAMADSDSMIEGLIGQMTVEEKAGQLTLMGDLLRLPETFARVNPDYRETNGQKAEAEIRAGRLGGLFNGAGVAAGRRLQKVATEESRLKIPLIFGADVIHGFHTVFPIGLGEAASFEPDLAQRTARAAALEATAFGLHWTFAPMVDIARDQRWGRAAEGAGEDVLLGRLFAEARVRGFQGRDLRDPDSLLACPKHMAAYGAVGAGMDYNSVELSDQTLYEVYLPPFRQAFLAGALSTMSGFNDINGVPASASRRLLTDVLRRQWGFKGFVVSDYESDLELVAHGYARDDRDAARLALLAGVDMSMASGLYIKHLPGLVADGSVPMSAVDESVRRVLFVKKALGLFDDPFRSLDAEKEATRSLTPTARALSREAGRKSIVLLKNDGNLLPLARTTRIALVGPFADDVANLNGPWAPFADRRLGVSLAAGIGSQLTNPGELTVVKGCDIESPIAGGLDQALAAARAAEVILLAVGEGNAMSGEAQSRTAIVLPPDQQALVEAMAATGKPMVVMLRSGRALALSGAARNARAILATWFLGTETGNAVADILFGAAGPSGRLPVSFPFESGQEPFYYSHRGTGRPEVIGKPSEYKARYRETANTALFAFGHGLTYGDIRYDKPAVSEPTLAWDGTIRVSAKVTNAGKREAEEVVQLYIHDKVASLTRPVRELKGFQKVRLKPGESRVVSFVLARRELEFIGEDLVPVAEPGEFEVWVCGSAVTGEAAVFTLVGQ
ncbi:beta-glucosidase [Caulobacter ginsengisoli]|uniref:beta-glucosidase n=1 Tax=Caulobacter ginsengisoli TaxID=400775 RepID=A0ABU0IU66_9CAUL|nr:glycoside hydrolase family 3 N-terminal domain-containing protein [Caulobacter ginsengisoli]MDQ0464955.1 beta-glucosidase [Caulobacter ginsengisoli]